MAGGDTFNMAEEFADVDFNEERLEKRFRRTMETLSKDPRNEEPRNKLLGIFVGVEIYYTGVVHTPIRKVF
jgi:hypothetical protein